MMKMIVHSETCCSAVKIYSVAKKDNDLYNNETRDSLGVYYAVGVSNGRYIYQQPGLDRYLEYTDHGDWMVSLMVMMTR